MMRLVLLLFVGLTTALGPLCAQAQGYPVTGGEHDGFTRVVIHAPPGIAWTQDPGGREWRLTVRPPGAGFDLSRLFDRIARTRLAGAEAAPGGLTLELGCDCPVTAWEERPGLIVVDIADARHPPDPPGPPAEPGVAQSPAADHGPVGPPLATVAPEGPTPAETPLPMSTARHIGVLLARQHAQEAAPEPTQPPTPDRDSLTRSLGLPIAQALSQGLLDPAEGRIGVPPTLLDPAPPLGGALPENLRVTTVLDRPDPDAPAANAPQPDCPGVEALAFMTRQPAEPFATAYARLSRQLFGEFDQPDPDARRQLIELYLASGFGAEARRLLEGGTDPVAGRDLLLGVADILEGRSSNSRMRVAQTLDCGGAASVFALLAGGERDTVPGQAIALTFTQMPPALRAVIGADLAHRLIAGRDRDPARIVAESLRRSAWTSPARLAEIDAALAHDRGEDAAAAARLEHLPPGQTDSRTIQRRLDLALTAEQRVAGAYLAGAEAFASAERGGESGPDLMAALIRLRARDAAFAEAFEALDRLISWLPETGENARLTGDLRSLLWDTLARDGSDRDLVGAVLEREDWRDPGLPVATRRALADRLISLGLAPPVAVLIPEPANAADAVLRARAALELGAPHDALDWLAEHSTVQARATRAAAFEALGEAEAALQEYQQMGDAEQAARSAIAARDWDRLRRLQAEAGVDSAIDPASGSLLERPHGGAAAPPDPVAEADRSGTSDEPQRAGSGIGPLPATQAPARLSPPAPAAPGQAGIQRPVPGTPAPDNAGLAGRDRSVTPPVSGTPPGEPVDGMPGASGQPADAMTAAARRPVADNEPSQVAAFDALGPIGRGAALLAESARLRAAIDPLLRDAP